MNRLLIAAAVLLFPAVAYAQAKTGVDSGSIVKSLEPFLIAVVVPGLVQVAKAAWYAMPKWLMPILAGALGPVLDQLVALTAGTPSSPLLAVLMGLAGVGVREVANQVGKAV